VSKTNISSQERLTGTIVLYVFCRNNK